MAQPVVIGIVSVLVLGIGAQWLAWRFKVPSILLLLAFGFLAGPVTGLLHLEPDAPWLSAFVSLSIGVILFEGGLSLRLEDLREVGGAVLNLVTIGVLVTWVLGGLAAYYIAGFNLALAALIGAILTVTGPTVIVPLLRQVRPTGRIGTVAKWEGITIDPVGAILSVLVLETIVLLNQTGAEAGGVREAALHAFEGLLSTVVVSVGISVLGAALLVLLLRRRLVPDYLQNSVALMVVVATFALANMLQEEAGLMEVTLMGIIMANQQYVPVRHISEFKEDLQVLLLAGLFILLSARLELSALQWIDGSAFLFLAALIFIVRPLAVMLSTLRTPLNGREQAFLAWLAPRGIVAAAVASLFALRLEEFYPEAQIGRMVPVVFFVIVGTVAVYGLTLSPLARWLGLAQPNPQGLLFVGAHDWAREMAKTLKKLGFTVLLIDSNAHNIRQARQEGLLAERANALSEHVIDELDLSGIGRLIALTPNDEVNSLATLHFIEVFESAEVYQISTQVDVRREGSLPKHLRGRPLFGKDVTYSSLSHRFERGDEIRPLEITEGRTVEVLRDYYKGDMLPLFLVRGEKLFIFSEESGASPQAGDVLLALVAPTGEGGAFWQKELEAVQEDHQQNGAFDELVEEAVTADVEALDSYEALVRNVSTRLAERVKIDPEVITERFIAGAWQERTVVARGALLTHFRLKGLDHPQLAMVRCREGLHLASDGEEEEEWKEAAPLHAFFFLISPESYPSQHLRILANLASRINEEQFIDEWQAAPEEQGLREVLLRKEGAREGETTGE